MSVRALDALTPIVCLRRVEEPSQQRLGNRIAPHTRLDADGHKTIVSHAVAPLASHTFDSPCSSVVSGMASSTIPTASTTTVTGRLNRTRDAGASSNEVKWPELLDKFKQTQERARRRNERLLRGADADTNLGGGRVTRSLLDGVDGGRSSRASASDGRGTGAGLEVSRAGPRQPGTVGTPGGQAFLKAGSGLTASLAAGERPAPHKRGHSLAGGLGKFASGIARAGSSRDRDKGKK